LEKKLAEIKAELAWFDLAPCSIDPAPATSWREYRRLTKAKPVHKVHAHHCQLCDLARETRHCPQAPGHGLFVGVGVLEQHRCSA
jgi:hypothetical protein